MRDVKWVHSTDHRSRHNTPLRQRFAPNNDCVPLFPKSWIRTCLHRYIYSLMNFRETRMHSSRMRTSRSLPYGGVSVGGGYLSGGLCPGGGGLRQGNPLPPRGQTDTCKNITLPQTSFASGKNHRTVFKTRHKFRIYLISINHRHTQYFAFCGRKNLCVEDKMSVR